MIAPYNGVQTRTVRVRLICLFCSALFCFLALRRRCQVFGENKDKQNIDTLVLQPPETLPITASDGELLEQQREVRKERPSASWSCTCVRASFLLEKGTVQ